MPGKSTDYVIPDVPTGSRSWPEAGLNRWHSIAIGIEYSSAPDLLIFLHLNQFLLLCGALRRCPVKTVGGKLQKRCDRRRASRGDELETFQQMTQPAAIGATVVCNEMDVGRTLAVTTTAAADGLDEVIRARCRREDHRNLRCLWEALVQFRPTGHLPVGYKDNLGLTRRVNWFVIRASEFESLAGFGCSIGAIHKTGHFVKIPSGDRGSFPGESRYGIAILWKRSNE